MFYMDEIYKQAEQDHGTRTFKGGGYTSLLFMGIRIVKQTDEKYIIEDMQRGGNYYQEIAPEEYELFRKEGWRKAVFQIALKKYQDKVDKINESIQKEANSKKNQRSLQLYQEEKTRVLNKYYTITQKLNLLYENN